jgi:phage terminase large subunit
MAARKIQTTRIYTEIEQAAQKGYTTISLQGSARSSKTYNTLIWLITHCLNHPGTRLSIVRATLPSLKGSVFVDFCEILQRMGRYDAKQMNKSDFIYRFPNGSWVEFFSADSDQKLRGRKRDILFVNEANELGFLEWQQLKLRTTKLSIVDYNPSFSDEHWLCSLNHDTRTYHFISTYKDNPFLEQTVIDEIESLKEKNHSLWQIYGLGLQAAVEGLVFDHFEIVDKIPRHVKHRYAGIDFGYTNDPTAIVEVGIYEDRIYIDEVAYSTRMLSSDIIDTIKQSSEISRLELIAESADPRLGDEIHRAGINIKPVRKFKGSIEAGLSKMQEYTLCVTRRSVNVAKELRNYTYQQDKEGKWLNIPIDCYNHAIDAIRYVIMEKVLGGKPQRIDTRRLERLIY